MAAATLLVVAIFFLPVYLKKGIYTMPGFLFDRYDGRVRTTMAVFWLLLYVFVNLTSVLYLGALSLNTILGIPMTYSIIGLALFAMLYSIYGGLKAVAWTDVVQVVFLIAGGLATTYIALGMVGDGDAWQGLTILRNEVPGHFSMILSKGEMMVADGKGGTRDAYLDLPGLSVLIGGMWITNLSYWGFNQYITQRALAAKNLDEAQKGMIFAGFLKLLMPLIVVIPGIAALVIVNNGTDLGFI
jgi:SSS family solute:Na+ symporter